MPYWIIDLDEKGKPLMFGWYRNFDKAEVYKDKNCSRLARVVGPTKYRTRAKAREELADDLKELLGDRRAVLVVRNR
jgi:hypothetical protein